MRLTNNVLTCEKEECEYRVSRLYLLFPAKTPTARLMAQHPRSGGFGFNSFLPLMQRIATQGYIATTKCRLGKRKQKKGTKIAMDLTGKVRARRAGRAIVLAKLNHFQRSKSRSILGLSAGGSLAQPDSIVSNASQRSLDQ